MRQYTSGQGGREKTPLTMELVASFDCVVKTADRIVDLGPEGGDRSGEIVVSETPEQVAACGRSHTGRFLDALNPKRWIDGSHPKPGPAGAGVFVQTPEAIAKLRALAQDKRSGLTPAQIQGYIGQPVSADRALASPAIDEAQAKGVNSKRIQLARSWLSAGDEFAAHGLPAVAVIDYGLVWGTVTE
jgi:hypothetical protein